MKVAVQCGQEFTAPPVLDEAMGESENRVSGEVVELPKAVDWESSNEMAEATAGRPAEISISLSVVVGNSGELLEDCSGLMETVVDAVGRR